MGAAPPPPSRFRFPAPRVHPAAAYLLAVALPSLAMLGNVSMRPWLEDVPYVLFFLAVSTAAVLGGWWPGAIAVGASAAFGTAFLATSASLTHQGHARVGAIVFLPVGLVSAGLGALFRAAFLEREDAIGALARSEAREREKAAALTAAARARDEFLDAASHELKTPLTSMLLQLQKLARRRSHGAPALDPDLERSLALVERQLGRMTKLVNDLLDVSRFGAGMAPLALAEVDLAEVARDVLERFSAESEACGSALSLSAPGPVPGRWDRERLDQVVTNLVSNALRYGRGQPIAVTVAGDGQTASLVVADHGIGIPAEEQARIFGRFERGSATRQVGGLGIGLWIVREAVRLLGGDVGVESRVGEGACFTVRLPQAGPRPA